MSAEIIGGIVRKAFSELISNLGDDLVAMAKRDDKTINFSVSRDNEDRILAHKSLSDSGFLETRTDHQIGVFYSTLVLPGFEDSVRITKDAYESYLDDSNWRAALEVGGVDNWEHYHQSLKDFGYFGEED